MKQLIARILNDSAVKNHEFHGVDHWERVAENGRIIGLNEGLNDRLLVLFGYFHDCQRLNDGMDAEHGPRAAEYLLTYTPEEIGLSEEDYQKLIFACRFHTFECETDDIIIKACWDADKLDIERVGIKLDFNRLYTQTAKYIASGKLKRSEI